MTTRRPLFVLAVLAGSFLLFLVQPMVARMALPRLGGAPAVWNSAMLVYQALLLAGYLWAHWLGRFGLRVQAALHLALLVAAGALWLPIGLIRWTLPAGADPAWWVPWLIGWSIWPLFVAIAAQAPLIQRWFAAASGGEDPYRLYAASNLGSFGGLVAYPLVVEPLLPVRTQSVAWSVGYGVLVVLVAGCAALLPRGAGRAAAAVAPATPPLRVAHWIALALVPSGLMLATSTYITTDIVAMPLLWVIPLGLYLLSWTVAFAADRTLADLLTRIAPITILLFGGVMIAGYQEQPWANAAMALTVLFMASVALHTALFRSRPAAEALTGFYLATATGGALGGIFAGLVAPVAFDWTYEFPLLVLAAGALVPQLYLTPGLRALWHDPPRRAAMLATIGVALAALVGLRLWGPPALFGEAHRGLPFVVIAALGLVALGRRGPYVALLAGSLLLFGGMRTLALSWQGDARTRSYFGVYTVEPLADRRQLDHGTTVHGVQLTGSPARERTPTSYYVAGSGVGEAMALVPSLYGAGARIGVVGLGTGTLGCYARPGQRWRFYEIDPAIVAIARTRFSYLARCVPDAAIVVGDARLSLAAGPAGRLDLLALDAFSSDAIPVHLMTEEAFATYARALAPRGLLLVHVSNRFVDLKPVVAAAARRGGWHAAVRFYRPGTLERADEAASPSEWIALSRDAQVFGRLTEGGDWTPLAGPPRAWTDDYSSILPLIRVGE